MKVVTVIIRNGMVEYMEIPRGVEVVVKDYHNDNFPPERFSYDDDGLRYVETIWGDNQP